MVFIIQIYRLSELSCANEKAILHKRESSLSFSLFINHISLCTSCLKALRCLNIIQ
eukprot:jgi/Antlo1/891/2077